MNRLVVLHQGAIGDFILALPVIQAVREATDAAHVLAIASAPAARLAAGRSAVDARLSPDEAALHSLFRDGPPDSRLADPLNEATHILSFLSNPAEGLHDRLVRFTSARVISLDPRPTKETLTRRRHITSQWTAAIREQGLPIADPGPARIRLSLPKGTFSPVGRAALSGGQASCSSAASPAHRLAAGNPPISATRLLIHPGSGGRAKCWPAERFVALANALAPRWQVHWILGPVELETAPERFAIIRQRRSARAEPLLVVDDLLRVAEHILTMDLYIGNDAGTTHLAAALGIRTLAIFGPTDPAVWHPLGEHVTVVSPPGPAPIETVPVGAVPVHLT